MSTAAREFTSGPLSFRLEPETGFVRAICWHGHEVLRGIYPAVRDQDWGTVSPAAAPLAMDDVGGTLRLRIDAQVASGSIGLQWRAEIEAHAGGRLRYHWRGEVTREFSTNRTGLCVLHPAELAGSPCVIEHTDGRRDPGWFPQPVSPHQPFQDVRAIAHVLAPRTEVIVRMTGEVFETEDQRNWSDASFKTYCRPLAWPRPYTLTTGTVIEHTVELEIRGPANFPVAAPVARRLAESGARGRLPRIGFTLPGPVPTALRERLRALRPAHLRVETTAEELSAALAWAELEAANLGCALLVAVRDATVSPPPRTRSMASCSVELFNSAGNSVGADVLAAWRDAGFETLGTGTLNNFTELNRERPPADGAHHHTTFGLNAQVHAFDDTSLLETTTQHGDLARQAHAIGAGRPVSVALRLGPAADSPDPRLHTGFAPLWIVLSLAQLASADCVERATYLRTHGPGGFLREDTVTPAERLFLLLAGATDAQRLAWPADVASSLDALLVTCADAQHLLLAHRGDASAEIELPFTGNGGFLGFEPAPFAAGRLQLPPHSFWHLQLRA